MRMISKISAAALSAVLFVPVWAHADTRTLTYTIGTENAPYTYTFVLDSFNTADGTLTGVELSVTNTYTVSATVNNPTSGSVNYKKATASVKLMVDVTADPATLNVANTFTTSPASGSVAANSQKPYLNPVSGTLPAVSESYTNSADLAFFEGTATSTVDYAAKGIGTYTGSGAGLFFGGSASSGGTFTVVYTYTPSDPPDPPGAPEPSTWAMMGLGFAALGFAGYRARRSPRAIV